MEILSEFLTTFLKFLFFIVDILIAIYIGYFLRKRKDSGKSIKGYVAGIVVFVIAVATFSILVIFN